MKTLAIAVGLMLLVSPVWASEPKKVEWFTPNSQWMKMQFEELEMLAPLVKSSGTNLVYSSGGSPASTSPSPVTVMQPQQPMQTPTFSPLPPPGSGPQGPAPGVILPSVPSANSPGPNGEPGNNDPLKPAVPWHPPDPGPPPGSGPQ